MHHELRPIASKPGWAIRWPVGETWGERFGVRIALWLLSHVTRGVMHTLLFAVGGAVGACLATVGIGALLPPWAGIIWWVGIVYGVWHCADWIDKVIPRKQYVGLPVWRQLRVRHEPGTRYEGLFGHPIQ